MYLILYLTPFVYLSFHGWAAKNLIDTTVYDRLAQFFYIISTIVWLTEFLGSKGKCS